MEFRDQAVAVAPRERGGGHRRATDGDAGLSPQALGRLVVHPVLRRRLALRLLTEVPSYARLSTEEYAAVGVPPAPGPSARDVGELDTAQREFFFAAGHTRARQGITVGDLLAACRIAQIELCAAAQRAGHGGGGAAASLQLFEATAAYVDASMASILDGHRQAELELARNEHRARASIVRHMLSGDPWDPALRHSFEAHGLDLTGMIRAVRCRPTAACDAGELMRYFQRSRGLGRAAGMVALVDADVCGFVPDLPRERAPAVIGVSEPVPAHALPDAFAAASRALDAAIAMNVGPGIYDLGAIGVRAAVHADRDIGAMLARRFIAPLREKGRSGEVILDTVRRHLENECHLDTTAREMWVHVNTVRYRLRRFESLTDCSLRRTDDLVAVWWALAYVGLEGEPVVPVVGGDEEDGA